MFRVLESKEHAFAERMYGSVALTRAPCETETSVCHMVCSNEPIKSRDTDSQSP